MKGGRPGMPKKARNDAAGVYYVRVYGYRNCPVFLRERDKNIYISRICHYREQTGIRVYAYLIEDNTAHLVVETRAKGQLADFMKRLGISYSRYFRSHYAVDHVRIFRDRYTSEKITDRRKLIGLVRLLHRDKGKKIRPYSSYREYSRLYPGIDTKPILDELRYFGTGTESRPGEGMRLGEKVERGAFSDQEVKKLLEQECEKIKEKDPLMDEQECLFSAVRSLLKDRRISIRQIGRVSGLSKSKVDRLR